jgi:hypothetical protein
MNLENLKPAWKQFVLTNSMYSAEQNEILSIIGNTQLHKSKRLPVYMAITLVFIMLTVCCQGG